MPHTVGLRSGGVAARAARSACATPIAQPRLELVRIDTGDRPSTSPRNTDDWKPLSRDEVVHGRPAKLEPLRRLVHCPEPSSHDSLPLAAKSSISDPDSQASIEPDTRWTAVDGGGRRWTVRCVAAYAPQEQVRSEVRSWAAWLTRSSPRGGTRLRCRGCSRCSGGHITVLAQLPRRGLGEGR
jgi:hypothetical protein